jgi:hypothetical protein
LNQNFLLWKNVRQGEAVREADGGELMSFSAGISVSLGISEQSGSVSANTRRGKLFADVR